MCSHMASFLFDKALSSICGWAVTQISGSVPEHWSPAVMSRTEPELPLLLWSLRARRSQPSQYWLSASFFKLRHFYRFKKSFYFMTYKWWDTKSLYWFHLRNNNLKLFHFFKNAFFFFFHRLVNLCPSLILRDAASLFSSLTDLLTLTQIVLKCSQMHLVVAAISTVCTHFCQEFCWLYYGSLCFNIRILCVWFMYRASRKYPQRCTGSTFSIVLNFDTPF